jgi:hypothetical protein
MNFHDELRHMRACPDSTSWARDYQTAQAAWDACERGDWMLWWAARRDVRRQDLVLAACACARLALPHARGVAAGLAIATAERWARGDERVTLDELRAVAAAARDIAFAADASAAAAAAAAYSESAAHSTAAYCASVASSARAADAGIPREGTLRKCADICRDFWKEVP